MTWWRYSDDVMEISPPTMSRYLHDFTEISPSPDRDISAKWWRYLAYFCRNKASKIYFYLKKSPNEAQKLSKNTSKTQKNIIFTPKKALFFVHKTPFFYRKTTTLSTPNCHTFTPKLWQFWWLNRIVFISVPQRKTDCTGRQKHLPIYTILPCLRYPIAK